MEDMSPYYNNFEKCGLTPMDIEVELNERKSGVQTTGILSAYSEEELETILAEWDFEENYDGLPTYEDYEHCLNN